MRIGTSPPNEKCENSITDAARIVATPASTALPPRWRMRSPASTDKGWPPATTPRFPRTTGRKVSARDVETGRPAKIIEVSRQNTDRVRLRVSMGGIPRFVLEWRLSTSLWPQSIHDYKIRHDLHVNPEQSFNPVTTNGFCW